MHISNFYIQEIVESADLAPGESMSTTAIFADPALVDNTAGDELSGNESQSVNLIVPGFRRQCSVYLVARFDFGAGDEGRQFNFGIHVTNPRGIRAHCHWWILGPDPMRASDGEPQFDSSFKVEYSEFSFTFLEEGEHVITLDPWSPPTNLETPMTFDQWNAVFGPVLARTTINVIVA
jgi:hypothetical protein